MKRALSILCMVVGLLPLSILAQTITEDDLLLELVAQQGKQLHEQDSVLQHHASSLWLPLLFEPLPIRSLNDTIQPNPYAIQTIRDNARRYITLHHADLYQGVSDPSRLEEMQMDQLEIPPAMVSDIEEERIERRKAVHDMFSPWRRELNLSLQITQNYASDNWYQGSSSAFAMLGSVKGILNYHKDRISWDNMWEWRAGYSTTSGDTLHHVNTTDDIFRIYSKAGVQFHPQVYGSLFAEFKTNLWRNWKKNQRFLATDFFTPLRYSMGLGVDYKPIAGLSLNVAPLTYKMVFALNSDPNQVDVTEYGIPEGKNILNELGSSLRLDWKYRPLREIQLEAEFNFYTNYHRVETELELTCHFIINRFMSAKVMLHPRYDSSAEIKEGRKTKIQFKEFISVGFAHSFR